MTPQVQALLATVPGLRDLAPADLPAQEALDDCRALLVALAQLQAVVTRRLTDVHTRGLHELEAARSVGAWAARQDTPAPPALVALAKQLSGLPHLQTALLDGRVSADAACAVAAAVRRARPFLDRPDGQIDGVDGEAALGNVVLRGVLEVIGREHGGSLGTEREQHELIGALLAVHDAPTSQADRLEQAFTLAAGRLPARRVTPALALLLDALLPQQLADRTDDAHDRRRLDLRHDHGGGWTLTGHLDEVTGEMLRVALTAIAAVDPDNPGDTAAWPKPAPTTPVP